MSHFSSLLQFILKTSLSSTQSKGQTFDKVDNQTFGDTLQKLNQQLMEKTPAGSNRILKDGLLNARQLSIHGKLREFLTEYNS